MTYVWLDGGNGVLRFVDDQHLPPCNDCGERVSVCRENNCLGEDEVDEDDPEPDNCVVCQRTYCACDQMYESYKDSLLD